MTTCLGKSCSFGLLYVSIVKIYQFMRVCVIWFTVCMCHESLSICVCVYVLLSLLILRVDVGTDCISS